MPLLVKRQTAKLVNWAIEAAAWLRQMKAALHQPVRRDIAAGNIAFGEMVDRGVNRIRRMSGRRRF